MEPATQHEVTLPKGAEDWLLEFLDSQLGAVVVYQPLKDEESGTVHDFQQTYRHSHTEIPSPSELILVGQTENFSSSVDGAQPSLHHQLMHVWHSGLKTQNRFYHAGMGAYYRIVSSRLKRGILVVAYDITAEIRVQDEEEQQAALINGILDASVNGVFAMEAERDQTGKIIDFRFLKINQQFAAMVGKTEAELIGNRYSTVFPHSFTNGLFDLKCEVIETGQTISKEMFYKGGGINRWFSLSISKLGQHGIVETLMDITDSKEDKQEVERLAQKLQTIIGTSQSGVHIFSPVFDNGGEVIDFRMAMVNQIIGDYIGQTVESLTGALASTYFPAYKNNGLFEIYKDCYLNGTRHHFDFHYEDGYDVFFNLLVVKLENEIMVTLTDHTRLKRLQRELEASIAELKRSNASLEQFAHAASHDLKDPLRKIIVYADKLLSEHADEIDDTGFGYLERIRTASRRMHRLVQDLLVFAEVGANNNTFEEVDLNKLVAEVVTDLEVSIAERDAVIHLGELCTIKGDSLHLQQLFQNLIANSLKYARHEVRPEIAITTKLLTGADTGLPLQEMEMKQVYCEVCVKDNGQGFSAEDAKQIFKIFQRLPQHRTEQAGTGIGLAIVQRVVENHKGYIIAEGVPGEGATFRVYLPVN